MKHIVQIILPYLRDKDKIKVLVTCKKFTKLVPKTFYTDLHNYNSVMHLNFIDHIKNIRLHVRVCKFTEHMLRYVTHLTLDDNFNERIDNLPKGLKQLTLG